MLLHYNVFILMNIKIRRMFNTGVVDLLQFLLSYINSMGHSVIM